MKTNMISFIAAMLIAGSATAGDNNTSASYDVDVAASTIKWYGKKVTGQHTGMINLSEGKIEYSANQMESGAFMIDMSTITCTDLKDEDMNQKLVGHLKSDDFFGVADHPYSILEIKQVKFDSDKEYTLNGIITIRGISKEVEFKASVEEYNGIITASAQMVLDRSEFNVKYNSGSFIENLGDKLIYDEFYLEISLTANKTSNL